MQTRDDGLTLGLKQLAPSSWSPTLQWSRSLSLAGFFTLGTLKSKFIG